MDIITVDLIENVNMKSIAIHSCAESLLFILKDIEDMESDACKRSEEDYRGLANIVEQMAERIKNESSEIWIMTDAVNYYPKMDGE